MERALAETRVQGRGVHTTTDFHRRILRHPAFRAGTHGLDLVDGLDATEDTSS
jgi:acetyl-CoA carboxylase biotin carboxylase subunit